MDRSVPRLRLWIRLLGDLAVAVASFYAAFRVRMHLPLPWTAHLLPVDRISFFSDFWPLVALAQPVALYFFGLYDRPQPRLAVERTRRLLPAVALLVLGLGAFFFLAERTFPRSVLVVFAGIDLALLGAWRAAFGNGRRHMPLRLVLVGRGPAAAELAAALRREPYPEMEIAGWVHIPGDAAGVDGDVPDSGGLGSEGGSTRGNDLDGDRGLGPCLGTVDDLPALLRDGAADDVVIADDEARWKSRLLDSLASASGGARGNVLLLPGAFESMIGRMRYRWVRDLPLIEVVRDSEWRLLRPLKRSVDLVAGTVLLILAAPLLGLCALLVKLTSEGPVFYRQERVGRGFERFTLWKLRTMRTDAEAESREVLAAPDDPRLTPVGAVLRRYRLDELPQLLNVLGGSMSLVGPRPERPGFVARFLEEIPGYAERFSVAPGLTGLAQVNGEYHSTARNKLRYDLAYIANCNLWLDLAILVRTIKIVLTSRGI